MPARLPPEIRKKNCALAAQPTATTRVVPETRRSDPPRSAWAKQSRRDAAEKWDTRCCRRTFDPPRVVGSLPPLSASDALNGAKARWPGKYDTRLDRASAFSKCWPNGQRSRQEAAQWPKSKAGSRKTNRQPCANSTQRRLCWQRVTRSRRKRQRHEAR